MDNDHLSFIGSTGGLLTEVYSISESEFRRNDIKRKRTSSHSDDYIASSQSSASSESDSDYEIQKKKGKKKNMKRMYYCDRCNYSSLRKRYVDKHTKIHENDSTLLQCTECAQSFTNSSIMESHMRLHTMKVDSKCQNDNSDESCVIVNVENITNPNIRQYRCNQCNFASTNITTVKIHKRCHIKERPFRCPKCPYATCDSLILTKHVKIHNAVPKPLKCDICNKQFSEAALTQHKVQHFTVEQYFQCGICPFKCVALV